MFKNNHLTKKQRSNTSNSKYVFIDGKTALPFRNILPVNSRSNCGKEASICMKKCEPKVTKQPPPVPPLPLILLQRNKNEGLKVHVPNTQVCCSNSNLQPSAIRENSSNKIKLLNQHINSTNAAGQLNKNVAESSLKPNLQVSKPVKRQAPKPPTISPKNQLSQLKNQKSDQTDKLKSFSLSKNNKHEISNTAFYDKVIDHTELLTEDVRQCPSVMTLSDVPPKLPAKKLSHDTKILFGYSMKDQVDTRKLHSCNSYSALETTSLANFTPCVSVEVLKVPQLSSSLDCINTVATKKELGNNQTITNVSSRELFYKSLSLRNHKKSKFKNVKDESLSKASHPVSPDAIESSSILNIANQYPRNVKKAKNVDSNTGCKNVPRSKSSTNDLNFTEIPKEEHLFCVEQFPKVVAVYENISIPFQESDVKQSIKTQHENSNNDTHLRDGSEYSEKSSISMGVTNDNYVKLICSPQITSNLEQSKSTDLSQPIDDTAIEINKNNQKTAELFLDNLSKSPFPSNKHKNVFSEQVAYKENGIGDRDILKCNIPILEACHEMHNIPFLESRNDAKVITKVRSNDINNTMFQKENMTTPEQHVMKLMSKPQSMAKVVHFAKEDFAAVQKTLQSELYSFPSENDSPYISYKSGVNTQNRNSEICPAAKSARLLKETSTHTSSKQTSTTSEVSSLNKLGPSKINNQGIVVFPPAGTMSAQQFNTAMLFRQLEAAIANGHHKRAAILAKELALQKVACSLTSLNIHEESIEEKPIMVNLYIEDKNLHQGPFPFLVHSTMTLGALKSKLEKEFTLPEKLQRWILGKKLATDNDATLQDYGVTETGCSIFLYLICSDSDENQNNLLEALSKIPKKIAVQKLWNLSDTYDENTEADSLQDADEENIVFTSNTNEDDRVSDNEDSYFINSSSVSSASNVDSGADDSESDESRCHISTPDKHLISDYEVSDENVSEHSFNSSVVAEEDSVFEQQENTALNYEQNGNELNSCQLNELYIDTNNRKISHLMEENVNIYSVNTVPAMISVDEVHEDDVDIRKEQTKEFPITSHIPITEETVTEPNLHSYSLDGERIDTADLNSDAEREQPYEENEVFFKASEENINSVNKTLLTTEQEDDLLKPEGSSVISPIVDSQYQMEYDKLDEMGNEQHGYLPDMEYIALIHEFTAVTEEDGYIYEENQIKPAPNINYAIPTSIQLTGENVEDLNKSEQIQILMPNVRIPTIHTDEKMEQNAVEKQVEVEEQHGYLPEMEFIAVINEFDNEAGEEEHEGSQVEPFTYINYAIPTALELSEQRIEEFANAESIQIWIPPVSATQSLDERVEQNSAVVCVSCGSLRTSPNDLCKLCKTDANMENAVDRSEETNKNAESLPVQESTDCSREIKNDYHYLMQLDNQDLIPNAEPFWCPVCFVDIQERQGVVLRDCLHQFCKECQAGSIEYAESTIVKCPFRNEEYSCDSHLQEREIKAVVSTEVFERYLRRGVIAAEGCADNSFHCKMPDCPGWCILDDPVTTFQCPTCSHTNCLRCQAVHEGLTCQQYQDELEYQLARNEEVKETKNYLESMVKEGKAMLCPKCDAFVIKRWGCDWLKCSVCQTEICWVTKKARWGPEGHGDTSGGCQCGLNGKRCHPKCNYCH